MKNKKQRIIILIIVFIILIAGAVAVYLLQEEPIKEEWGNIYYGYLKEKVEIKENQTLEFIEIKDQEAPVMIMNYQKNNKNYATIYYIEEKKVNEIVLEEISKVELLYNLKTEEYQYYLELEKENKIYYDSLENQIKNNTNQNIEIDPEFTFDKNEDIKEGDLTEFDTQFIKVDQEQKSLKILEKKKQLKEWINTSIEEFETLEEKLTEERQKSITASAQKRKEAIEIYEKKKKGEIYNSLKGVWITEDNLVLDINDRNNQKYFVWGWFASEAFVLGNIIDIKCTSENVYEFTIEDIVSHENQIIEIKLEDKKEIKIDVDAYKYVAENMDKAYEILL